MHVASKTGTGRGAPQVVLRLPQELKDWLSHRAIDNRRSVNGELLYLLEQAKQAGQGAQA